MRPLSATFVILTGFTVVACSGSDGSPIDGSGGELATNGGAATTGGSVGTGGSASGSTTSAAGGSIAAQGGSSATSGGSTQTAGGTSGVGGTSSDGGSDLGGTTSSGGVTATGGASTGGKAATGGAPATGGKAATGGAPATGGKAATGGAPATGGKAATGGAPATGGKAATGGAPGTGGGTSTVNCSGTPLSGGTTYSSNGSGNVAGGYHYELWRDGNGGSMTVFGVGAAFKANWNNSGDYLARVGLKWNETQTYDQYGTISADYAYSKTGTGGGYSFIGIYGWSTNPLIEYYIVDDWFGSGPPTGGGTLKGTFDVDGGTYKIYTFQRVNKPSIKGTTTFMQYFSVRQTARQCGHISITEHFKQWASLGLNLGKMYECKILVEAGGGSGSIEFTSATLTAVK